MWYKNVGITFFCSVPINAFDGQTDKQTAFWWLYRALHYMQSHGKNT